MATSKTPTSTSTALATAQPKHWGLVNKFAGRLGVEPEKLANTLKGTCFRGKDGKEVTDAQMMALLVVAEEYRLNPFLKQLYAFPDKNTGGIVPFIGVDGWIRIVNEHPQFKELEFKYPDVDDDEVYPWIEIWIWRKDRDKPIVVREWYNECKRNTDPWNTMPRRMLRHKTLSQGARVAFGFTGIYDEEDAAVIAAIDVTPGSPANPKKKPTIAEPPRALADDALATDEQLATLRGVLESSGIPPNEMLDQFNFAGWDEITFDKVADILAWINQHKS